MAYRIPGAARSIIKGLADAILPVPDWLSQPDRKPPKLAEFIPALTSVPWRSGNGAASLSTSDFDIVAFLEYAAERDEPLERVAARWRQVAAKPTNFFKARNGESAEAWRARRSGLSKDADTRFGAFETTVSRWQFSNYWFVTQDTQGNPKDAVSREAFYDVCWAPLQDAFTAFNPAANGWLKFANGLRDDNIQAWPKTKDVHSSLFMRQFTIDILVATLGQKNPAASAKGPLWPRAVLIEAGENRTPGNKYSVEQAATAVQHLKNPP